MTSPGGRLLERSGAAAVLLALLVLAGFVVIFADSLSRTTELEAEVARASASVAGLEELVADGQRELEFIETDEFLLQQARAVGWGKRTEQAFTLPAGAPSPAPLVSLGEEGPAGEEAAPFDEWMALLFGA